MTLETFPDVQVSVLVPVKDEAPTLARLVAEIDAAFTGLPDVDYEIVLVDDGSTDSSWAALTRLATTHDRVRALRLRRNFGKAAALAAAVDAARGERIITMDADLQDDPAEVPRLLAELDAGADLVSGHKADRKDPLGRRLASKLYNRATGTITGLRLNDHNCGLKAARAEVFRRVPLYGELHRYSPALAHQLGYRVHELPVNHRPRRHGHSKYGFERYARGAIDLLTVLTITKYGRRPGHLFGGLGIVAGLVGFVLLTFLSAVKLFGGQPIGDRPLLMLGILLVILGVQLVSIGLIAEIVLHRTADRREATDLVAERTPLQNADPFPLIPAGPGSDRPHDG